jgi:hypothetical protein
MLVEANDEAIAFRFFSRAGVLVDTYTLYASPSTHVPSAPIHLLPDFNGDGKADLLWRHPTGLVDLWLMGGPSISSTRTYDIGWDWGVQGVGDFNGDGKADILWRHTSGLGDMWLMNGPSIASANTHQYMIDMGWTIQGVGDFNGDGKADILWRHTSGLVDIWLMDGPTIVKAAGSPCSTTSG